jgi:O-antigen/teichoic acid export membrane protein
VYGAGSVAHRIVTFALLPVLTRFLEPAELGASALLDVTVACTVALFSLGVGSSLTVCWSEARTPAARNTIVASALGLLGASLVVLVALGLAGSPLLSRALFGSADRTGLVWLALATAALLVLQVPLQMRLQLEGRAARSVWLSLAATVVLVVASLVGVVALGRGLRGLWEGRLLAQAIALLLFALPLGLGRPIPFDRATARDLLRLGAPMVPSFAAVFVLLQGNRYVLSWFADLSTVGVYSVGIQLGMAMSLAVSAFSTAWTPYYLTFRDRPLEASAVFSRIFTYYALGFGGLALLFYACARAALLALTVPPFDAGFRVAGHAASAMLFVGLFNLLLPAATFAREIGWTGAIQVGAALLSIGLNLALIPVFGLEGAGLALALGTGSMAALLWAWNRSRGARYLQVRYDLRRLAPFAAFYVAAATLLVRPRSLGLGAECVLALSATAVIALVVWTILGREHRAVVWTRLRSPFHA